MGSNDGSVLKLGPTKLYRERWFQLGMLSFLALISDWVCFSTASSPRTFEAVYDHNAEFLIDIFLYSNVFSCFFVTDTVSRFGMEKSIKGAASLMLVGCLLRSEGYLSSLLNLSDGITPYSVVVLGTVLVGFAQPFFQCTPPMLSATWFGSKERALSTAVALNANQIGIATAFLVGGSMCHGTDAASMMKYFGLITAACAAVTGVTLMKFEDKPKMPPSSSEARKIALNEKEPPFFQSVKNFLTNKDFYPPLAAFVASITITNIVGAFIDEVMERGGITEQLQINLAGAGFELAILVGGIVIGGYVDKTKAFKRSTLVTLAISFFLLYPLGLTEHAIGKEPGLVLVSLFGLGFVAGPIQPVNAELAVEVTYPSDETAVESTQQIFGNLISALMVPVAAKAANVDFEIFPDFPAGGYIASDVRGDVVLLSIVAALTYGLYSTFDAPLKRSMLDCELGDEMDEVCDVSLETTK